MLLYCMLVSSLFNSSTTCFGLLGHLQVCTCLVIFSERVQQWKKKHRIKQHIDGDITYNTHWTLQCSRMLKYTIYISLWTMLIKTVYEIIEFVFIFFGRGVGWDSLLGTSAFLQFIITLASPPFIFSLSSLFSISKSLLFPCLIFLSNDYHNCSGRCLKGLDIIEIKVLKYV
jgi:hypothetical protein